MFSFLQHTMPWNKGKIWDQGNTQAVLKRGISISYVDNRKWCFTWNPRYEQEIDGRWGVTEGLQAEEIAPGKALSGRKHRMAVVWERERELCTTRTERQTMQDFYFHIKKFDFILKSRVSLLTLVVEDWFKRSSEPYWCRASWIVR